MASLAADTTPAPWVSCYLKKAASIGTGDKEQKCTLSFSVDPCQGTQDISTPDCNVLDTVRANWSQGHQASPCLLLHDLHGRLWSTERSSGLWI